MKTIRISKNGHYLVFPESWEEKDKSFKFKCTCNKIGFTTMRYTKVSKDYTIPCLCGRIYGVEYKKFWEFWK